MLESSSVSEFVTDGVGYCKRCMYCCVYSTRTPDDGQRNCPNYVEFYSKNKFEKLVHLVGFIVRIYHDAWPSECQFRMGNLHQKWFGKTNFDLCIRTSSKLSILPT